MSNIIGESFKEYVAQQVNIRQQKLGQFSKDPNTILFTTANSPYIKLTSGVDIEPEKCLEIGLDTKYAGNNLAKQYILLGGTSYKTTNDPRGVDEQRTTNKAESTRLRGGITPSYNDLFGPSAYGLTSNPDYGLSPMPGITSINVKAKNRGSLRECTINLTCHNRLQFYIIETLFLRLKYPFLLEYGHSVYFDNNGTLITTPPSNSDYFLLPDNTQKELLELVESTRESSSGNYDAFLGYVTNFNWNIRPDGGFDITLIGTTPGDVIESLKINVLKTDDDDEDEKNDDEAPSIEKDKNKTTLNQIFFAIKDIAEGEDGWTEESYVVIDKIPTQALRTHLKSLPETRGVLKEKYAEYEVGSLSTTSNPNENLNGKREVVRLEFDFDNEDTGEEQYYIKFGTLLRMVEMFCLVYDTSIVDQPPIISIDNDFNSNYCFTIPQQFSSDPRICLIPISPDYNKSLNEAASWYMRDAGKDLKKFNNALGLGFRTSKPFIGNLMDIHVNMNYISKTLSNNLDKNGKLSLYDFLSSLLQGMQNAMGGINNFEVIYNEDTNEMRFMDNTQIPGIEDFIKETGVTETFEPTLINANVLKPNFGSFVKNVGIKSEITNDIANMMTVGAQANGNIVGENATAFSHWNKGLIDRIVKEKQNSKEEAEININPSTPPGESPAEKFKKYQEKVSEFLLTVVRLSVNEDDISTYSTNIKPYYEYIVGSYSQEKKGNPPVIPPLGFIPLSLDIEMLGISGIKIYQKYKINEDLLPPNYNNRIEFITKGVNHKVDSSGWSTSIDGQTIPKNSEASQTIPQIFNQTTSASPPIERNRISPPLNNNTSQDEPEFVSEGGSCNILLANSPSFGGTPPSRFNNNGFTRFFSPLGDQTSAVTSAYTGNNLRFVEGVYSGPKPHRGTDLDVVGGAEKFPTYAIWDGTILQLTSGGGGYRVVYEVDTNSLRTQAPQIYNELSSDYGFDQNLDKFKISKGAKLIVVYYHLEPGNGSTPCVPSNIQVGSKITKGQFIAVADNTGKSSGAHLHINMNVVPNEGSWNSWVFGDSQARSKVQIDPMDWIYVRGVN